MTPVALLYPFALLTSIGLIARRIYFTYHTLFGSRYITANFLMSFISIKLLS